MIVGKTKNTPQGLPYGVAVAGLSWSVLVSQFDFAQSKTVETVTGSYAVLEFDVYTTVLVELNLLGIGGREVVPSSYIDILSHKPTIIPIPPHKTSSVPKAMPSQKVSTFVLYHIQTRTLGGYSR